MEYVVDIVFLHNAEEKLVVKEVAIVSIFTNSIAHWIVSPSTPFSSLSYKLRHRNNKKTLSQTNLHWNDGQSSWAEVKSALITLLYDSTRIYVHGQEKESFLKILLPFHNNIVDLSGFHCPNYGIIPNLQIHCLHHDGYKRNSQICALSQAANLVSFVVNNAERFILDKDLLKSKLGDNKCILFKVVQ